MKLCFSSPITLTIPTEHTPQVIIKQDCISSFLKGHMHCAVYRSLLFLFCSFISLPPILLIFALHILIFVQPYMKSNMNN